VVNVKRKRVLVLISCVPLKRLSAALRYTPRRQWGNSWLTGARVRANRCRIVRIEIVSGVEGLLLKQDPGRQHVDARYFRSKILLQKRHFHRSQLRGGPAIGFQNGLPLNEAGFGTLGGAHCIDSLPVRPRLVRRAGVSRPGPNLDSVWRTRLP